MSLLILALRLIHILAGVFWVGGSVTTTLFISPATAATGSAGNRFLVHLLRNLNITQRFAGAAGVTVLAGAALFWIDSHGLTSPWTSSGPGWGFGLGAIFALLGFAMGIRIGVLTRKLGSIASATDGEPTQGQLLELDTSQRAVYRLRLIQDSLLVIALACMATARYWGG